MKSPAKLASRIPPALLAHLAYLLASTWLVAGALEPGTLVYGHDSLAQFLPWREYAAAEMAAGRFPAYDPYLFCGVPFAANPQVGIFYPPNVLFLLLPAELALTACAALHLYLAAAFAFHLLRAEGTGALASTAAGWSWGFGGFAAGHLLAGHATILAALPWLPLLVLALLEWARTGSRRAFAAGALAWAMAALAGHPQFAFLTAVAALAWLLYRTGTRRGDARRAWAGAAGILLLGTLMAAVQLLPAWDLARRCSRGGGLGGRAAAFLECPPEEALALVVPDAFGHHDPFYVESGAGVPDGRAPYRGRGANWETGIYVGIVPLALGFLALPFGRPSRGQVALALAAIAAFWLSTGVPGAGLGYFRVPARFLYLVSFALAVLGARGFDEWLRGEGSRRAAAIAAALAALGALGWRLLGDPQGSTLRTVLVAGIAALLLALGPRRRVALALAALVAVDLAENCRHAVRPVARPEIRLADPPPGEHERILGGASLETVNHHLPARIRTAAGYDPLIPEAYERLVLRASARGDLSARTYLDPPPLPSLARVLAIESSGGPPRAYLAGRPRALPEEEALRAVLRPGWRPVEDAVVTGVHVTGEFAPPAGGVRFLDDDPGLVRLEVETRGRALLVLADPFDPGWSAEVDGERSEIVRAQFLHRGVFLEPGHHVVTFEYRVPYLLEGAIASGIGLALALLLVVFPRRTTTLAPRDGIHPANSY